MDQETSEEKLFTKARQVARRLQIDSLTALLGSKTLGTDVIEFQFLMCWQTMIKTSSLGLGLLKVCLFVKLESSDCKIYRTKSARLDRLNHVQIYFSAEFPIQPKPV